MKRNDDKEKEGKKMKKNVVYTIGNNENKKKRC